MRERTPKLNINSLLALLLFAVFAVCILSALTTGAGVYRLLVERDDAAYTERTAERYMASKLRQSSGEVSIEELSGVTSLALREELGGFDCVTYIYCFDGHLRELFTMEGDAVEPEAGEKILPMAALDGEIADGMLFLSLESPEGGESEIILSLRGKGEHE